MLNCLENRHITCLSVKKVLRQSCYVLDHTHPFSHGRTKVRLHLYDATLPRFAAYRSRQVTRLSDVDATKDTLTSVPYPSKDYTVVSSQYRVQLGKGSPVSQGCYVKYRVGKSWQKPYVSCLFLMFLSMCLSLRFLVQFILSRAFHRSVRRCHARNKIKSFQAYFVFLVIRFGCIHKNILIEESHGKISIALPILLGFKLWNVLNFLYVRTRALYTGHIQKVECVSCCFGVGYICKILNVWVWVITCIICSFAEQLCKFAIITPYFKLILISYEYKNTIKATTQC